MVQQEWGLEELAPNDPPPHCRVSFPAENLRAASIFVPVIAGYLSAQRDHICVRDTKAIRVRYPKGTAKERFSAILYGCLCLIADMHIMGIPAALGGTAFVTMFVMEPGQLQQDQNQAGAKIRMPGAPAGPPPTAAGGGFCRGGPGTSHSGVAPALGPISTAWLWAQSQRLGAVCCFGSPGQEEGGCSWGDQGCDVDGRHFGLRSRAAALTLLLGTCMETSQLLCREVGAVWTDMERLVGVPHLPDL